MKCWETDKIRLRGVKASDLEDYYLKIDEEDSESLRNSDRLIFPVGFEVRAERVAQLSKQNPYSEVYTLIIENKKGQPVGNINTHSCNGIDGVFKYGLGILAAHRGQGYATDAIRLLCKYYFDELDYKKVEVHVYEFNEASIRLHKKLGFTHEGTLRKNHYAKGKRWDTLCFGLLREEFDESQSFDI